jgi:two-component system LytT family sensor kinase
LENWDSFLSPFAFLRSFNQPENQLELDIKTILSAWFISFLFLMIAWILNSKLASIFFCTKKKWNLISKILIVIISNSLLLFILMFISSIAAEGIRNNVESNYFLMFIRGFVAIALIYLIQYMLNLNVRNQSISLQNQMLKTENIRAQFEILRQQISPHFLFNSLSTLRSMIRSSNKNAENFVIKLSDIYRLLLLNKEKDTVSLKEELELIDDYSFLLFARYENMLSINIDIPENILNYNIPTFSLQLLLENCVKHNIVSKEKPLHVKIYDSGINSITVENNLQQKTASR